MTNPIWRVVARLVARPSVSDVLIRRAKRTPYFHITSADGTAVYMERYWLFNRYDRAGGPRFPWLPSIRVHCIRRADQDRHLHDHPWNARTIILGGWYFEQRRHSGAMREPGDTASLRFGEYHRIAAVAPHGVWTLFITGRRRGTWGFNVDGRKVPWKEYLKERDE